MRRAGGAFATLLLAGCGQAAEPAVADNAQAPANVAVAAATPSPTPRPKREVCADWQPKDRAEHGMFLEKPLPIPAAFADIASATTNVMTVQSLSGPPVCIRLEWIGEASEFTLSPDKRFFQFDHQGYEAFGHIVVDRLGRTEVETGEAPTFSTDGRYFAAAQVSASGFGGLEAIGLWEVGKTGIAQLAKLETGVMEGEWTVNGFGPGPCVALTLQADLVLGDGSGRKPAPPEDLALVRQGGKWSLAKGSACQASNAP